ncbi:MAG: hypothetical protein BMS9Abin26_0316 [Gammaproteobacteria bacterium]|nr:MAG: hypothetical protein BMS9Abin26_0316 [Gammaproteobacteria bacterium]
MKRFKYFLLASLVSLSLSISLAPNAMADTGDYIWNEQFGKKLDKALQGNKRAMYEIGNMYMKGQGTDVNLTEAFGWFLKAANAGHKKSEYKIGSLYLRGQGTSKNARKAFTWISKAASKGYGPAQFQIGRLYQTGTGVKRDLNKSLGWYSKANDSGYNPAIKAIKVVKREIASQSREVASRSVAPPPAPAKPVVRRPARVTRRPAPAPVVSKPVALKSGAGSHASMVKHLKNTLWIKKGKPANEFPSANTRCIFKSDSIRCMSSSVSEVSQKADVTYQVQTIITASSGKSFQAKYRRNYLYVMPVDLDEPNPEALPFLEGWEKSFHVLKCNFKGKNQINCSSGKNLKVTYSRQR